jgi:hypothetical protein
MLCKDKHGGYCRQPVTGPNFMCQYPSHNIGRAHVYGQLSTSANAMRTKFSQANANAGSRGESLAMQLLINTFGRDPAVFIFVDRRAPVASTMASRISFNIDFLVVRARRLLVVDAKQWPAGTYWTARKLAHHGWHFREPYKGLTSRDEQGQPHMNQTMEWSLQLLRQALGGRTEPDGTPQRWTVNGAYLIVPPRDHPEAWKSYHLWLLRTKGAAKLIAGHPATPRKLRNLVGTQQPGPDDESVLKWLRDLNTQPAQTGRSR